MNRIISTTSSMSETRSDGECVVLATAIGRLIGKPRHPVSSKLIQEQKAAAERLGENSIKPIRESLRDGRGRQGMNSCTLPALATVQEPGSDTRPSAQRILIESQPDTWVKPIDYDREELPV